ncbi:MAG: dihydroorotate dehydrogenase [Chloroflexota bacterium]|nr:dihydroorotate dehydrogenase [Chloroflexota bacterium]
MVDLGVDLCGVSLSNPLVLASGIWGSCAHTLIRLARRGAGVVTSKSCSLMPRMGHPNPTVLHWEGGLINAVGLSNPGAKTQRAVLRKAKEGLTPLGVPLIASVFGESESAFRRAVELVAEAEPDFIELNISCPNVESEFGEPFALNPAAAGKVTAAVRSVYDGRLLVKLSPNAPNIVQVARAVASEGADGLTAVNTLGPGMIIDVHAGRPVLSNRVGGISGAALRPVAVRCVYDLAASVDIPIIGTGGVLDGEDAVQMIMAGATAVGVGSALEVHGDGAFQHILKGLEGFMMSEGYERLDDFRGCAHD